MAMYGVQRSEKYKRQDIAGIEKEATRTAKHYNNDVDISKSQYNINLVQTDNWMDRINDIVAETGVKTRKDSVMAVGGLYTATGEFFRPQAGETKEEWNNRIISYFNDCLDWHVKTYCQGNKDLLLSAMIHQDETTPHMHIYSVPILDRGNGEYSLSAKTIMGNRKAYTERVDSFYNNVSKQYGLERGERTPDGQTAKKHIETQKHKMQAVKKELDNKQAELARVETEITIKDFDRMDMEHKLQQLDIDIKNKKSEITEINSNISIYKFNENKHLQDIKQLKRNKQAIETELQSIKTDIANANGRLDRIMQTIQQKQELLNDLKSNYENYGYEDKMILDMLYEQYPELYNDYIKQAQEKIEQEFEYKPQVEDEQQL